MNEFKQPFPCCCQRNCSLKNTGRFWYIFYLTLLMENVSFSIYILNSNQVYHFIIGKAYRNATGNNVFCIFRPFFISSIRLSLSLGRPLKQRIKLHLWHSLDHMVATCITVKMAALWGRRNIHIVTWLYGVTVDRVLDGWICWPLIHITRNHK